jgi:2'-5' RNA ligase
VTAGRIAFAANWLFMSRRPRSTRFSRYAGTTRREPASVSLGERRYVTTVVRLPAEVAEQLAAAGSGLLGARSSHYPYPPQSIHLTVLGLADGAGLEQDVREIAKRHPPFGVEVRGLNVSRETVFAELYPVGSGLRELREGLRHLESREHGPASRWLRRRLAHANLIRFAGRAEPGLLAGVGRLRAARFGRFDVAEIELVQTDKVLSDQGTRTLGRFPLGPASGTDHPG